MMRIGFGYDIHAFAEGRKLILGGVEIPHTKGLKGHSDADVLLHAICDALLGAANMRDIGYHFPDTDGAFEGIDSKILLRKVGELLAKKGYHISNIDCTIVAEHPKINPHVEAMQRVVADQLEISSGDISIKATTNEGLGTVGREEGICAYAVALIANKEV